MQESSSHYLAFWPVASNISKSSQCRCGCGWEFREPGVGSALSFPAHLSLMRGVLLLFLPWRSVAVNAVSSIASSRVAAFSSGENCLMMFFLHNWEFLFNVTSTLVSCWSCGAGLGVHRGASGR